MPGVTAIQGGAAGQAGGAIGPEGEGAIVKVFHWHQSRAGRPARPGIRASRVPKVSVSDITTLFRRKTSLPTCLGSASPVTYTPTAQPA